MAQVSLAWIMGKDQVTAPIIGSTSLEHLKDIIGEQIAWITRFMF